MFAKICLLRFLIDRFVGFARGWLVRFVNMIYRGSTKLRVVRVHISLLAGTRPEHNEHFLETTCKPALEQCLIECDKYKKYKYKYRYIYKYKHKHKHNINSRRPPLTHLDKSSGACV